MPIDMFPRTIENRLKMGRYVPILRHQSARIEPRGDCGVDTKERYLEILEFTHFVEFFSFNKLGENHKEKVLVRKVTVVVALDLGTGNTKNPEYESEY